MSLPTRELRAEHTLTSKIKLGQTICQVITPAQTKQPSFTISTTLFSDSRTVPSFRLLSRNSINRLKTTFNRARSSTNPRLFFKTNKWILFKVTRKQISSVQAHFSSSSNLLLRKLMLSSFPDSSRFRRQRLEMLMNWEDHRLQIQLRFSRPSNRTLWTDHTMISMIENSQWQSKQIPWSAP